MTTWEERQVTISLNTSSGAASAGDMLTSEEAATSLVRLASESDQLIHNIRQLVAQLPPLELLLRAWFERLYGLALVETDLDMGPAETRAARLAEFLQSVVVVTPPAPSPLGEISDDNWTRLTSLVDRLFNTQEQYALMTAMATVDSGDGRAGRGQELRWLLPMLNMHSRGKNYPVHWYQYYDDMLMPMNDVLEKVFGLSSAALIRELKTFHIAQGTEMIESIRAYERLLRLQTVDDNDRQAPSAEHLLDSNDIASLTRAMRRDQGLVDRIFSCDLFNLDKVTKLPMDLLDALSWSPGEAESLFTRSEQKGWPLLDWPTFTRPLVKIGDAHYAFDQGVFADRILGSLEQAVQRRNSRQSRAWKNSQADAAEKAAVKYLSNLLPGADVFTDVHYNADGKMCETDSVIVYDGHMFIVEVKGGTYPPPSPLLDFESYIEHVRKWIEVPIRDQADRVRRAFEQNGELELYDGAGSKAARVARIMQSDIHSVRLIGVTLEPLTEFAAQIEHLEEIGVGIDLPQAWIVSVDDLRMCASVFDNPLVFLHYLQERCKGGSLQQLAANDELDHLGLYLSHNMYKEHVEEEINRVHADLYIPMDARMIIDRHLMRFAPGDTIPEGVRQEMPPEFAKIIDALGRSPKAGRSNVAFYLLDSGGDLRIDLDRQVRGDLLRQADLRRPLAMSLYGSEREGVTLFCWSANAIGRNAKLARDTAEAITIMNEEALRLLLEVVYDNRGRIRSVFWRWCEAGSISDTRRTELEPVADDLRKARVGAQLQRRSGDGSRATRKTSRRLGRNDQCPCGSGKKYKKCCLPRYGDEPRRLDVRAAHYVELGGERDAPHR